METSKLRISEEELIETVCRYSNFYDPADKYYHDTLRKGSAWEEISAVIMCPGKDQIIISINDGTLHRAPTCHETTLIVSLLCR
jgi:predicted component of viral defense system (DUF524 family)